MTTDPVTLKRDKKDFWREIRQDLMSPVAILCMAIILLQILWIPPTIYFFLWTYRMVPSGLVPAAVAFVLLGVGLWAIGNVFFSVFRWSKKLQPFRKAARAGDQQAIREMIALRKFKPSSRQVFLFHICITFSIAPFVALIIMSGDQGGLSSVRDHGKVRASTRSEDLEQRLTAIQRRGIFSAFWRLRSALDDRDKVHG